MVPVAPAPHPRQVQLLRPPQPDSDTCAKSYSYTKDAPESATAAVVGTVEAGGSPE